MNHSKAKVQAQYSNFQHGTADKTSTKMETSGRKTKIAVGLVITLLLVITAIAVGVGVSKSTHKSDYRVTKSGHKSESRRNIVLLVSLDGFRSDYLNADLAPTLYKLASSGVATDFMRSVFPTKTFPNHYTIVTGLYPESHGIVSNSFYDEKLNDTFRIGQPASFERKWWGGEPIWITAEKHGLKSASFFWVGSEAVPPTYWKKFNKSVPWTQRIDQVISWMKLEEPERPAIITMYFEEPDNSSHKYGPFSREVNATVRHVDNAVKELLDKLETEHLKNFTNLIVVSDHGMARVHCDKSVYLDQLTNLSDIKLMGLGAASLLYFKSGGNKKEEVYNDLKCSDKALYAFSTKSKSTPRRMHYQDNNRIGEVFLMPKIGHGILISNGTCQSYRKGYHGIDNTYEEMDTIFVASGPDFKTSYKTDHFQNIEVYNLLTDLLQVPAAQNNGTTGSLRHLLKPSFVKKLTKTSQKFAKFKWRKFPEDYNKTKENCKFCICPYCRRSIRSNIDLYHKSLDLTHKEVLESHIKHFPWGLPESREKNANETILLTQKNYITGYKTSLRLPSWVGYKLTKQQLEINVKRKNCFRMDIRLHENESAQCKDYYRSGFDRGHMAPNGDLNFNRKSEQDTFILSNIAPQHPNFNRGTWLRLEDLTRKYAVKYDTIHVISGAIFDEDNNGKVDGVGEEKKWLNNRTGRVAIPTHFYKMFMKCNNPSRMTVDKCMNNLDVLLLVLPHNKEKICKLRSLEDYLRLHVATIKDLELLTGLHFFEKLPLEVQMKMKIKLTTQLW